jgi:RHS repeat-associated protein
MGARKLSYYEEESLIPLAIGKQLFSKGGTRIFTKKSQKNRLDYYPFGILLPNRHESTSEYRYGYQGSEKDNEIKGPGNSHTTYFRQLDPRVGRWLSIDPKATAFESPYISMGNNPMLYNDALEDTIIFAENSTPEFKKQAYEAFRYLKENDAESTILKLSSSTVTYTLQEDNKNSSFDSKTNTVYWDPTMGVLTTEGHIMSPTAVLSHEAEHAYGKEKNPTQYQKDVETPDENYRNLEEKRVIIGPEQETAIKLGEIKEGEVTRKDHYGVRIETKGPTSIEDKNEVVITIK